jgi:ribonuclease HI
MSRVVEIYVDGACRGNPGPGGWAALIREGDNDYSVSGAELHTTNQRMALTAAINALESLKEPCKVKLYSDSETLVNGMNRWIHRWMARGWKTNDRKPVQNQDLWQRLMNLTMNTLFTERRHKVEWIHIPAHMGRPENGLVNQLAQDAITRLSNG